MNTAITAEYNPFHNGHLLHIEKTRQMTGGGIIVIMSGNFVQRGEPAVFEKHIRTRHALLNGADMVLELPVEYATGGADVFARAAVTIAAKSGIIGALSFGSEEGTTQRLEAAAELFADEPESFKNAFARYSAQGLSYPAARESAAAEVLGCDMSFLGLPNNILAVEYLSAIKRLKADIRPITVKRAENGYNDSELSGGISSASAVRAALLRGEVPEIALPLVVANDCKGHKLPDINGYSDILRYLLRVLPTERLKATADITEGLENRLKDVFTAGDIKTALMAAKTKRYTYTKLQRAALHIILGITKDMQCAEPAYIRVLGVRRDKKHLLAELSEKSALPVITAVKKNEALLENEIRAADIYHLLTDGRTGEEYTAGMVIV